jgi:phage gp36-like protein
MAYFTFQQLNAVIPGQFATEALDDDGDGIVDAFDEVLEEATVQVNASLEGRYELPLTGTIPAIVQEAAKCFGAELCYVRRNREVPKDLATRIATARKTLAKFSENKKQLTPGAKSKRPRAAVISEKSRVSSASLNS